jgi:hypothetical protein
MGIQRQQALVSRRALFAESVPPPEKLRGIPFGISEEDFAGCLERKNR